MVRKLTLWFDRENQVEIHGVVDKILGILNKYNNPQFHKAMVSKLTEPVLGSTPQMDILLSSSPD